MLPHTIDRYQIIEKLGSGGMGIVYLAQDSKFNRKVAIKVLNPSVGADPKNRERFRREANAIAQIEHSAVVPVHDYGEEGEQFFLVMRFMEGGSLKERIGEGGMPLKEAARIIRKIASALDKAHSMGMIHRDLKPGNILFDLEENPYITDFGLVKFTDESIQLTQSELFGTPAYISPEQGLGDTKIDARSDIYSLTAMFFNMVTGVTPYQSSNPMGMIMKQVNDPTPKIANVADDLPIELQTVIDRGMAKAPADRYPTAGEMAKDIDRVLASAPSGEQTEKLAHDGYMEQRQIRSAGEEQLLAATESAVVNSPVPEKKDIPPVASGYGETPTIVDSIPWKPVSTTPASSPPIARENIQRVGLWEIIGSRLKALSGKEKSIEDGFANIPGSAGNNWNNLASASSQRGKSGKKAVEIGIQTIFTLVSIIGLVLFVTWLLAGGGEELQTFIQQYFSFPGDWTDLFKR